MNRRRSCRAQRVVMGVAAFWTAICDCQGLLEPFASQTDAYLVVDESFVPVHSAILAIHSPVFAELYGTAASKSTHNGQNKVCIPMSGHSVEDVCCAVKYMYLRGVCQLADAPSQQLWTSVDIACPIIRFAHKYNMKVILEESESCLLERVPKILGTSVSVDTAHIFQTVEATAAWASLADECKLSKLFAQSELFMACNTDSSFWHSSNVGLQLLSQASLLRVLRVGQLDTINHRKNQKCYSHYSTTDPAQKTRIEELISWQ